MQHPKIFLSLDKLQFEIKIENKIVGDKTLKGILSREIENRNMYVKEM